MLVYRPIAALLVSKVLNLINKNFFSNWPIKILCKFLLLICGSILPGTIYPTDIDSSSYF
jgi:hypothetical protein